jgi:hypothetical protein
MMEKEGTEIKMEDAAGFFANIFGGDRFMDYVRPLYPNYASMSHLACRSEKSRL